MRSRPLSHARLISFLCLASAWSTAACTGTAPYGVGDEAGDAAGADRPLPNDDGAVTSNDAAGTVDAPFDGGIGSVDLRIPPPDLPPPPVALPLPASGPRPQRLLFGTDDRLAGDSVSSCSHQEPASGDGDRWCAFFRPGTEGGNTELWVVNLTKTAAGIAPVCNGTSPNCRRLTKTLWTTFAFSGPTHPFSHKFDGDTLLYYADAVPPSKDIYRGPVYAWRPGWDAPRMLTSGEGLWCFGHPTRAVAHCLDQLVGNEKKADSFELRAGSLDPPPPGPLPSLGRIRPLRTGDTSAWQASFTPDGTQFVFSHPAPDPAVETLRIIATADLGRGTPRVLRDDVTSWSIAKDSRRYYFMRPTMLDPVQGQDEFDLFASDLSDGAPAVTIGSRALDYAPLGTGTADDGVSFLAKIGGDQRAFRIARNSHVPEASQTIFSYRGLLEGLHVSGDSRYTVWLDARFNGRVVDHGDLSVCRLNTHTDVAVFEPLFLHSAGLVFFSQDGIDEFNERDGLYARPNDCQGVQRFAVRLDQYVTLGDRGLIYTDDRTPAGEVTFKYAKAINEGGAWRLDVPVAIHNNVDSGFFTVLGGEPKYTLFRTATNDGAVWVFGPLPL